MFRRMLRQLLLVTAVLLTLVIAAPASAVEMTFYGNQHFKFVSDEGKVILINPWVKGNKDAPMTLDSYKKGDVDLILTTSGHGDDQGNAVEIAAKTGARIFTVAELGLWSDAWLRRPQSSCPRHGRWACAVSCLEGRRW